MYIQMIILFGKESRIKKSKIKNQKSKIKKSKNQNKKSSKRQKRQDLAFDWIGKVGKVKANRTNNLRIIEGAASLPDI